MLCFCEEIIKIEVMGKWDRQSNRFYINALPFSLEDEDLEDALFEVLSSYGTVKSVRLVFEGGTLRPKGLCFAEMSTPLEVDTVIEALDGLYVAGYFLEVRKTIPRLVTSQGVHSQVVA